jgi:hypothetical protein
MMKKPPLKIAVDRGLQYSPQRDASPSRHCASAIAPICNSAG